MVILDEDESRLAVRFLQYHVGENPVDLSIAFPVALAESGPVERNMAQRPKPFVRQPVIVFFLQLFAQPDAAQSIGRMLRRHFEPAALIGDFAVGVAAAVATQTPPQARITGSSAVASPLAGWMQATPSSDADECKVRDLRPR